MTAPDLSISDPRFNLREIAKQLLLLEQHLLESGKFCPDCITKHLLTVEALADECQALDANQGCWCEAARQIGSWGRRWGTMFSEARSPTLIGQEVRHVRKHLAPLVLGFAAEDNIDLGDASAVADRNWTGWVLFVGLTSVALWWINKREGAVR